MPSTERAPRRRDAVESVFVVDEDCLAFGQDRIVGGVPRDRESLGDPGDGEVLHDEYF